MYISLNVLFKFAGVLDLLKVPSSLQAENYLKNQI